MHPSKTSISFIVVALVGAGCATSAVGFGPQPSDGGGGGTIASGSSAACTPCTTDKDCTSGATCAQFQGDTFCAQPCPNGDECGTTDACSLETSFAGDQVSVCVPTIALCGTGVGPVSDGGAPTQPPAPAGCDAGPSTACGTLIAPTAPASCSSCGGKNTCQTNGCYGGWWCDTATSKCSAPPVSCSAAPVCSGGGGDAGGGRIDIDAGGPVVGTVGATGGTVSRLFFTAVGDTRPANEDDTAGYPSTIIGQIYSGIAALNPMPTFSISTGDYQFSNPSGSQASSQMDLYLSARAKFPGAFFPAMGNHECTGATASNCGSGNTNGVTSNYTSFVTKLLGPIQQTSPYYSIAINAEDGSWTSKFVFIAANAWDSTQSSWLSSAMAKATTYTFVVRHEATGTSGPPGVSPSDSIINGFPYTLLIVGHTHSYGHKSTKEVLFGNGGAPLTGSSNYGYGLFSQRSDGAIVIDAIDYQSGQADPSFHFAVTPAGVVTP